MKTPNETSHHPRTRLVFAWASFVVPLAVAILGTRSHPDAAHDDAAIRVLGLGFTGPFRALDTWIAGPLMTLPLGTRSFRASLACAIVTGLAGFVTFLLAEPLFERDEQAGRAELVRIAHSRVGREARRADGRHERDEKKGPSRLSYAVTALGVVTALAAPPWQIEGSAVGGTVTGAVLVLAAAYLGLEKNVRSARIALLVGAALGWEPLVGVMALASALVPLAFAGKMPKVPSRGRSLRMAAAFVLGLAPFGLAFVAKAGSLALSASRDTWQNALGEHGERGAPLREFVSDELGYLFMVAAAVGAILALRRPETRPRAAVLVVLSLGLPLAYALDLSHGKTRYAAVVLVAIAALGALAGSGLYELVRHVRNIRVPFAPASAALLVVLEWTLPVRAADDSFTRRAALSRHAPHAFATSALGSAPPCAILLVGDADVLRRLQAARAAGLLREDVEPFPTFDLKSPLARDAVDHEPRLSGLYRDLALGILPEEWSLSSLAAARPLLLSYDPKWKAGLAKHLVPDGLFSRFEPEPQGLSDRRIAMEKSVKRRAYLAQEVAGTSRDTRLQGLIARLLRARAIAIGAVGERENLSKALDEVRPYVAKDDPVVSQLVRRMVLTHGALEVSDLVP